MERTNKDKISHCCVVSCSHFLNIFSVEEQNDYGRSHVIHSYSEKVKEARSSYLNDLINLSKNNPSVLFGTINSKVSLINL